MALFDDPVEDPLGLVPSSSNKDAAFDTIKPIRLGEDDAIGGKVLSQENRLNQEAQDTSFFSAVGAAFQSGDNFAYQVYKRLEREALSPPNDPNYKPADFIAKYRKEIPQRLESQFLLAGSETEAMLILSDIKDELKKQDMLARRGGFSTFVAQGLAGIVDLDTPLAVATGGLTAGAKLGINATKWGRMATAGLSGGLTQAAGAGLAFEAGTTQDWTSIPAAGLGGLAFGMLGGAIGKRVPEELANEAIQKTAKEFDEHIADGAKISERDIRTEVHVDEDVYHSRGAIKEAEAAELAAEEAAKEAGAPAKPKAFKLEDLELRPDSVGENEWQPGTVDRGSIGARQLNPQGSVATVENNRAQKIIANATKWEQTTGIVKDYFAKDSELARAGAAGDAVAKAAVRFHDAIAASPIATDLDRLMRSGSVVAQKLGYDLLESASGIFRNNRSGAMLKDWYEKQLLGSFLPAYDDAWKLWAKDQGLSFYDRILATEARDKFNKEILYELNGRAFDPPGTVRNVHPAVKAAADAHDRWSALDIEIGRGRPNEGSIKGYETIKAYSGYATQKWGSAAIEKLIRNGKSYKQVTEAIAEAYRKLHPWMKPDDAEKWAGAVTRRARATGLGADTNLIGMLQGDGREFLADMLKQNNLPQKEIDGLIDRLTGEAAERGQVGHTKGRIDVDMRFIAANGIKMIDLFDTDLVKTVSRRARGTSGAAALARKGILSKMDRADIIEAILEEQNARGPSMPTGTGVRDKLADAIDSDKHLTRKDLEDIFSYFDAGPIAGGISPVYANIKKLTNLALLNQLGLTQMAETGAQMASVGISRWWDHAGAAFKSAASDPKSELAKELRHIAVMLPEDRLFRDDLNLEMDKLGNASTDLAQRAQTLLNQGQRLQGYISGYYAVRNFQQRVAVTSAADKIMTNMKGLANDLSDARAADIGLDAKTYAKIKQYVDNGTVEFKDGNLYKLNFDKWNPDVVEDFALSLNRHVNQVVQKAMAGESSVLFHRDGIASLFFHLKAFPMLALEKQALRNLRTADGEAVTTFMAGLATAATAYTVKQAINNRPENLTASKIANGAFGLSNMTGWLPMWTDPVASMLGMNSLKFNDYARGVDNNIISTPATLTTLNRMANIPGALLNAASPFHEMSNNDVRALQTTPIFGNAYGFTAAFNAMKQ